MFVIVLGGTPYCDVSSSDVPARVMRGLRLPHLAYVGDELYQLMLQCWQLDLDERPTFQEMCIRDRRNLGLRYTILLQYDKSVLK